MVQQKQGHPTHQILPQISNYLVFSQFLNRLYTGKVVYSHLTIWLSVYLSTTSPQEQFKFLVLQILIEPEHLLVLVHSGSLLVLLNLLLLIQKRDRCSSPLLENSKKYHCKSTRRRNRDQTFWNYRTRNSHICRATIRTISIFGLPKPYVPSVGTEIQEVLWCIRISTVNRRETNALLLY